MRARAALALGLGLGCGAPAPPPVARAVPGAVEVESSAPISRVSVLDASGVPLSARTLAEPLPRATVPARWRPGERLRAEVQSGGQTWTVDVAVPEVVPLARLRLGAPLGQGQLELRDGAEIELRQVEGTVLQIGLEATAVEPVQIDVTHGDTADTRRLSVEGERALFTWAQAEADCAAGGCATAVEARLRALDDPARSETLRFTVRTRPVSLASAAEQLSLDEAVFPADILGFADPVREPDLIDLPSPALSALLRRWGLGVRGQDPLMPWAWQGVSLRNTSDEPVNAVIRARILDADGHPDPAFRPRVRDADDGTGTVSALLRVPAGQTARSALPVFVDEATLGGGPWIREVTVTPLGSDAPLHTSRRSIAVKRGSAAVAVGLGVTLVAAALGLTWTARRIRGWLGAWSTSELTTIALFGALNFSVSAASQLLGMGLSAALGPFSAFAVGLFDDALRTALWASLITLLPRPGVATLSVGVSWLLRVLALGSMGPMDLLFTGSHVFWLELCLFAAGLTRSGAWREQAGGWRGLRLALGFGVASALSTASGLALSAGFYRLFYAPWYALALILGPGFLYSALAAVLAIGFADALRRVER